MPTFENNQDVTYSRDYYVNINLLSKREIREFTYAFSIDFKENVEYLKSLKEYVKELLNRDNIVPTDDLSF